ncbi:helix-turn-helix domain-containing protein [Peptostreptococcus faecalis]|uniref:helix-turn-helix domain-containing protein n=1 Tax=Peptostreptococcus faecalis TaxID=2045015 RepID=UPI000C7B2B81|nr:helix-turn-helix transcriptional regulator [Peptostreptococcus faecalis]
MKSIITKRRKELGYTMKELANLTGVSEATISRWESGDIANMRQNNILSLSRALNVSPLHIIGLEDTVINGNNADLDSTREIINILIEKTVNNTISWNKLFNKTFSFEPGSFNFTFEFKPTALEESIKIEDFQEYIINNIESSYKQALFEIYNIAKKEDAIWSISDSESFFCEIEGLFYMIINVSVMTKPNEDGNMPEIFEITYLEILNIHNNKIESLGDNLHYPLINKLSDTVKNIFDSYKDRENLISEALDQLKKL